MKAIAHRLVPEFEFRLDEVDISTDAALHARYGLEIPVLMIDGTKVAKYRITEAELRKTMEARKARD